MPAWWPSPENPAAGVFFEDYARAFAVAGARVGVIYPDRVGLRHLRTLRQVKSLPLRPRIVTETIKRRSPESAIPVIRIRGMHTALGRPGIQMRRFRDWLRRGLDAYCRDNGRPDVLHAMCAIPSGWACLETAGTIGSRLVITEHTGPFRLALQPPSAAPFVFEALAGAEAVVAVSDDLRQQMRESGVTRPIEVIGNPVPPEFQPAAPPPPRCDANGRPTYRAVFVGRMTAAKGIRELLAAAERLRHESQFRFVWDLVGDGELRREIERRFRKSGMSEDYSLSGRLDRPGVARHIADAHFLVLPSHGENCPMAVCEALSIGRPVIGTRGTGCEPLIGPEDGALCRVADVNGLADAIRQIIGEYGRWDWRTISARARKRFSGPTIVERYASIFQRMTDRSGGKSGRPGL